MPILLDRCPAAKLTHEGGPSAHRPASVLNQFWDIFSEWPPISSTVVSLEPVELK